MYRIGFEADEIPYADIDFNIPFPCPSKKRYLICHPNTLLELESRIGKVYCMKDVHIIHPYEIITSEEMEEKILRYTGKILWFGSNCQVPKWLRVVSLFLRLARKEVEEAYVYFEIGDWPSLHSLTAKHFVVNKLDNLKW